MKEPDSQRDTDPTGLILSHDDIFAYLVGAMQRIELQMSELILLTTRVVDIEKKQRQQDITCHQHHGNGKQPIIR